MSHSVPTGRRARCSAQFVTLATLALTLSACKDVAAPTSTGVEMQTEGAPLSSQSAVAIPNEYIVVFKEDVADVGARAAALAKEHGANVRFTYTAAVKGF